MVASHTNAKRKVEVLLMGQRFTVRSDRDVLYIERLSRIVNDQLEDIKRSARTVSSHHAALLAALNIADELARTRELLAKAEEIQSALTKKAQATLAEVESALAFMPAELRGHNDAPESGNQTSAALGDTPKID